MSLVTFILCVILAIMSFWYAKKTGKKYLSLNLAFYIIWALVSLCSSFQLFGMNTPSLQANLLVFIMVASFAVGDILGKIIHKNKSKPREIKENKLNKLFYVACAISVFFNLIDSIFVVKEIFAGTPLWQIRNWTHEPFGAVNPILSHMTIFGYALRKILVDPMGYILPAVTAHSIFNEKTKNKSKKAGALLAISIVNLILSVIKGAGGRLAPLYFALIFIISFLGNRKKHGTSSRKARRLMIVVLSFLVAAVAVATIARTGLGNLFKQAYVYFALPTTLLSEWLPNIANSEHACGLLTFNGIFGYPMRILLSFGALLLVPNQYFLAREYLLGAEKYLFVGAGNYNAFVTPIYYFMYDGGIAFVILASILFGFLVSRFEEKEKDTLRHFCLYSLVFYGILVSFMRIQTAIPNYIISFLLVYIFLANFNIRGRADDEK